MNKYQIREIVGSKSFAVAVASALSLAGGLAAGHILTKKKLVSEFEVRLQEEIEGTRNFYAAVYKPDENNRPRTVREVAEDVLGQDAVKAFHDYTQYSKGDKEEVAVEIEETEAVVEEPIEEEPAAPIKRNIFEESKDGVTEFDYGLEVPRRGPTRPFIITFDEFNEGAEGFETISLTYFEGDDTLMDDQQMPFSDSDGVVGDDNLTRFGYGSGDANMLYIRNPGSQIDFEVARSKGKFAVEVLGLDDDEITHSDRPRGTRKFRHQDE